MFLLWSRHFLARGSRSSEARALDSCALDARLPLRIPLQARGQMRLCVSH
jgi:hypothetical protein